MGRGSGGYSSGQVSAIREYARSKGADLFTRHNSTSKTGTQFVVTDRRGTRHFTNRAGEARMLIRYFGRG